MPPLTVPRQYVKGRGDTRGNKVVKGSNTTMPADLILIAIGLITILGGIIISFIFVFKKLVAGKKVNEHENENQRYVSPRGEKSQPNQHHQEPTVPSQLNNIQFTRMNDCQGELVFNGEVFSTFDAGEIVIWDKHDKPVIAFTIGGYGNTPRELKIVKVSDDLHDPSKQAVVYYTQHNNNDAVHFQAWLDNEVYGGKYQTEAVYFKDLMYEMNRFNQLLQSKCVRTHGKNYVSA